MSEITDFHQLDICDCGGRLDCWTTHFTLEERQRTGLLGAHYRSEWICQDCGDVSDRLHDSEMQDISSQEAAEE